MELQIQDKVRHPIGFKIFGITGLLLVLMALVTLISTINLGRVDRQIGLLSDYYIPLDQIVGDIRFHQLLQTLSIERALNGKAAIDLNAARKEIQAVAAEIGDCEYEKVSVVSRKLRETKADPADRALQTYELNRYCGERKTAVATATVDRALALPFVLEDPELVRRFTQLQGELKHVPEARAALNASVDQFAAQSQAANAQSVGILKEQMDTHRRALGRATGAISRLLHTYTREAASKANHVEQRTALFNWAITFVAAILGLVSAGLITRNVIKPLRALLSGAKAVEHGDLNIAIKVQSADEMALLARAFNFMVGGLREKELIKTTFGKYIDPRIVKDLLDEHSFSEVGNKRVVTVFFSDIEGFTPIGEQLSAEAVVKLLNLYFSLMAGPIRDHNGIIDKYIGDAVMAFWGPPFTDEREHAVLACYSALDQVAKLAEFRASLPDVIGLRKGIPGFNMRIGICTGEVIAGSIGSDAAKSYTVIGDTVNLASRLEAANKTFGTHLLISETTRVLAGDAIETRDLDRIRVAGKTEPVGIYELLGRKGAVGADVLRLRDRFEEGIRRYRARDWEGAERHFRACRDLDAGDRASQVFLELVTRLREHPPPADWDGVWEVVK